MATSETVYHLLKFVFGTSASNVEKYFLRSAWSISKSDVAGNRKSCGLYLFYFLTLDSLRCGHKREEETSLRSRGMVAQGVKFLSGCRELCTHAHYSQSYSNYCRLLDR